MSWITEITTDRLNEMISNARTRIFFYEEHYNFTQSEAEKERMTFAINTALQTIKFYEQIIGGR